MVDDEPDPLSELRRKLRLDLDDDAAPAPTVSTPTARVVTGTTTAVGRSRGADDDRRRQLWRDSATILIGVVLVLLAGQVFIPQQTAGPAGSATPLPSEIAIGSVQAPVSLPPGATFGPIINPSLGVDASPTPIPVITMGPTPSPSPSILPSSSIRPSVKPTLKPTVKPTVKPTIKPTTKPTGTPQVTQPPPTDPPPSDTPTDSPPP
jgi:hypothetical protein